MLNKTPDSVDWREEGAVTPVKRQGKCASAWLLAAVGILEGLHKRIYGVLVELSAQYLNDCTNLQFSLEEKCENGADALEALWYAQKYGIYQSNEYTSNKNPVKIQFDIHKVVPNENSMVNVLYQYGPIIAKMKVSFPWFYFYSSGIFYEKNCEKGNWIWRSVLIVGYGHDKRLKLDYWIIKGDEGSNWGENGYMRLARNWNACGIREDVYYLVPDRLW